MKQIIEKMLFITFETEEGLNSFLNHFNDDFDGLFFNNGVNSIGIEGWPEALYATMLQFINYLRDTNFNYTIGIIEP